MSVNAAGSAQNVQQALYALRQTVQAEQIAAAVISEAATEAAKQSAQAATNEQQQDSTAVGAVNESEAGPGAHLDIRA